MKEQWKNVKGYEGYYKISSSQKVKNVKTGRILKNSLHKSTGYYRVTLIKNGKRKHAHLHRILAESFIDNPHNYPCVDHINKNRLDNNLNNLRWVSWSLNKRNSNLCENSTSKYNGVHFDVKKNKWVSQVQHNKKRKHLGLFSTELEAALKFNYYIIKHNIEAELNLIC